MFRIRDEQPGAYFRKLRNHLFWLKSLNYFMRIRDPQWKKNSDPGSGIRDPRWKKSATLISSNNAGSPAPRVRVRAMPHHLQEPGLPQGALTQARRQAFRLRPLRQGVPQPQESPDAQEGSPPARGEVSILFLREQYRNFYAKKKDK